MNITLKQLTDWLDSFHDSYIKAKKPIRGRTFSCLKMEIYGDAVTVVVTDPFLRGTDEEQKAFDFARSISFNDLNRTLTAELDQEKLIDLISGKYQLTDEDWLWDDE